MRQIALARICLILSGVTVWVGLAEIRYALGCLGMLARLDGGRGVGQRASALELSLDQFAILALVAASIALVVAKAATSVIAAPQGKDSGIIRRALPKTWPLGLFILCLGVVIVADMAVNVHWSQTSIVSLWGIRPYGPEQYLSRLEGILWVTSLAGLGLTFSGGVLFGTQKLKAGAAIKPPPVGVVALISVLSLAAASALILWVPVAWAVRMLLALVRTGAVGAMGGRKPFADCDVEFAEAWLGADNIFFIVGIGVTLGLGYAWRVLDRWKLRHGSDRRSRIGAIAVVGAGLGVLLSFWCMNQLRREASLPFRSGYLWLADKEGVIPNPLPTLRHNDEYAAESTLAGPKAVLPDIVAYFEQPVLARFYYEQGLGESRLQELVKASGCPPQWEPLVEARRGFSAAKLRRILEIACSPSAVSIMTDNVWEQERPLLGQVIGHHYSSVVVPLTESDEEECVPATAVRTVENLVLHVMRLRDQHRRVVWARDNSIRCSVNWKPGVHW